MQKDTLSTVTILTYSTLKIGILSESIHINHFIKFQFFFLMIGSIIIGTKETLFSEMTIDLCIWVQQVPHQSLSFLWSFFCCIKYVSTLICTICSVHEYLGSWTPLHADVFRSYSWSINICGRKLWILYPPHQESFLKDRWAFQSLTL
jgi:hypothetical protein